MASAASRTLVLTFCHALVGAAPMFAQQPARTLYPEWFIRTPSIAGVRMSIGYAPAYGDTAAAVKEAREFALASMRVTQGIRVRAEYLQEILPNGSVAYRGERYAEDTLAQPDTAGVISDRAFLPRMLLLLLASDSVFLTARRLPFAAQAPGWTEVTPSAGDGVYAVGTAAAHFNEYYSWKEAERQARRTLAFASSTRMQSAMESRTGGTANGALIASTETELRDVEIVERWRDDRRLFVLVRARVVRADAP